MSTIILGKNLTDFNLSKRAIPPGTALFFHLDFSKRYHDMNDQLHTKNFVTY